MDLMLTLYLFITSQDNILSSLLAEKLKNKYKIIEGISHSQKK